MQHKKTSLESTTTTRGIHAILRSILRKLTLAVEAEAGKSFSRYKGTEGGREGGRSTRWAKQDLFLLWRFACSAEIRLQSNFDRGGVPFLKDFDVTSKYAQTTWTQSRQGFVADIYGAWWRCGVGIGVEHAVHLMP